MTYIMKTPQIGEVCHEVTIVKFHKQVGEFVKKDEPIVTLETNKAALDVESAVSGIIDAIFFVEGTTVSAGTNLLAIRLNVEDAANASKSSEVRHSPHGQAYDYSTAGVQTASLLDWLSRLRNNDLSPRDKAYCRDQNVVPIRLHKKFKDFTSKGNLPFQAENKFYEDIELNKPQAQLLNTLVESQKHVVQSNIQCICDNTCIDQFRKRQRQDPSCLFVPTRLEVIAWSVVGAMQRHPCFRSRLVGTETLRQFKNPNLGIAVALSDDRLTTAIVPSVFSYDFARFTRQCRASIVEAKNDNHIVTYHPLVISDLSAEGVVNAIPTVVFPACATLFIGCPIQQDKRSFYLSLSFDHRFINGAGAAMFLKELRHNLRVITSPAEGIA